MGSYDVTTVQRTNKYTYKILQVLPENSPQSSGQRAPRGPRGGHSGVVWASFESLPNLAPFFGFHPVMSYPTINGITILKGRFLYTVIVLLIL